MLDYDFSIVQNWLVQHPETNLWLSLSLLLLVSWLSNYIVKKVLIRGIFRALRASAIGQHQVIQHSVFVARLANIVPALVISKGITLIDSVPATATTIVVNVCNAFVVLTIALAIANVLNLVNTVYEERPEAKTKPIKGYIQVLKILVYTITVILMIAALVDRSPLILLSGLGAMAAVLMLIFQDTILSLVASVQISSNDVIRVGDWVEMPQLHADGDVIDIALHTVKIQNFDKTITTIPTRRFMTDAFKNWRGMQQAGGRRIKRSLLLDQQSIHFLDADECQHLSRFSLLQDYLAEKQQEIDGWNGKLAEQGKEPVNTRRITNVGTFRAYVQRYLSSHPGVHQQMTLMARQLSPNADGLPLEVYCFTNTTAWLAYEGIQSDIFDHLLAILPEFGLRVYQHPSGMDIRAIQLTQTDRENTSLNAG